MNHTLYDIIFRLLWLSEITRSINLSIWVRFSTTNGPIHPLHFSLSPHFLSLKPLSLLSIDKPPILKPINSFFSHYREKSQKGIWFWVRIPGFWYSGVAKSGFQSYPDGERSITAVPDSKEVASTTAATPSLHSPWKWWDHSSIVITFWAQGPPHLWSSSTITTTATTTTISFFFFASRIFPNGWSFDSFP